MARFQVIDNDNTVDCDSLDEACRIAEKWYPENWNVQLAPSMRLDAINERLVEAFGAEDGAPEIQELDED